MEGGKQQWGEKAIGTWFINRATRCPVATLTYLDPTCHWREANPAGIYQRGGPFWKNQNESLELFWVVTVGARVQKLDLGPRRTKPPPVQLTVCTDKDIEQGSSRVISRRALQALELCED